jgi:hypothetical protein
MERLLSPLQEEQERSKTIQPELNLLLEELRKKANETAISE